MRVHCPIRQTIRALEAVPCAMGCCQSLLRRSQLKSKKRRPLLELQLDSSIGVSKFDTSYIYMVLDRKVLSSCAQVRDFVPLQVKRVSTDKMHDSS